jgi:hypothetical protein
MRDSKKGDLLMQQQRRNEGVLGPAAGAGDGDVTVEQALAMRDDQARLAAQCAERAERARAANQYGSMRRWTQEYRRATMRCRLLGERIRRERTAPTQRAARSAPTLARLTPRAVADIAPAGETA